MGGGRGDRVEECNGEKGRSGGGWVEEGVTEGGGM